MNRFFRDRAVNFLDSAIPDRQTFFIIYAPRVDRDSYVCRSITVSIHVGNDGCEHWTKRPNLARARQDALFQSTLLIRAISVSVTMCRALSVDSPTF